MGQVPKSSYSRTAIDHFLHCERRQRVAGKEPLGFNVLCCAELGAGAASSLADRGSDSPLAHPINRASSFCSLNRNLGKKWLLFCIAVQRRCQMRERTVALAGFTNSPGRGVWSARADGCESCKKGEHVRLSSGLLHRQNINHNNPAFFFATSLSDAFDSNCARVHDDLVSAASPCSHRNDIASSLPCPRVYVDRL